MVYIIILYSKGHKHCIGKHRGGIQLNKELILVIDDEMHILELVKYNLEKEGYRVIVCENGEGGPRGNRKETAPPCRFLT